MVSQTRARVVRYGLEGRGLDIFAVERSLDLEAARFDLCFQDKRTEIESRLVGHHNMRNIAAAAGAADALGIDLPTIKRGIEEVGLVRGRLERVDAPAAFNVFVDYAHTPDALANVLDALRDLATGRIICVFGCGGDRDRGKRPLMGRVVAEKADLAIVTSDNPRTEDPQSIIEQTLDGFDGVACRPPIAEIDRRCAIARAIDLARPGDAVLIAGKGHEDYQIIGTERRWFDDVRVAREILAQASEVMT
jgi:UDP-N-acetylmuramoyl-L-alanyl-D-glutamate--2,6-diaminopimelate ligase